MELTVEDVVRELEGTAAELFAKYQSLRTAVLDIPFVSRRMQPGAAPRLPIEETPILLQPAFYLPAPHGNLGRIRMVFKRDGPTTLDIELK